jgi:multidrug efflux pump subunit AcrA (membrane-fusion protein)
METTLFRKSSLERISSPERLNEYIKITHPGVWSVLLGCLALLAAACFWGFYGSIPDSVKASGILFPQNGVTSVIPAEGGRIGDMRVKVGDFVEAGQIIAVIPQEDVIRRINEMKANGQADEKKLSALYSEYESRSILVSPVSGIVLSAKAVNETVSADEAVAGIVKQEKYANDKQVICYIPVSTAKRLKEGMTVQVSPDFAPREEYGYMLGSITSIGAYPVSDADVLSAVGSRQYAQGLLPQENSVEVRVTLTVDPDSQDKIKWSGKKGESVRLSIGTSCSMLIVVKNYKPYELIF